MSDTPETDALWDAQTISDAPYRDAWQEMTDHSSKLERELNKVKENAERYRLEANAMMMQRDQIVDVAEMLIAMIRANYMHGNFTDCTIEKIDHHLRPWINKIESAKGTLIE
jgi:hypothetical protein